jgi:hypothetical protein
MCDDLSSFVRLFETKHIGCSVGGGLYQPKHATAVSVVRRPPIPIVVDPAPAVRAGSGDGASRPPAARTGDHRDRKKSRIDCLSAGGKESNFRITAMASEGG